jgi:hypothetical protein
MAFSVSLCSTLALTAAAFALAGPAAARTIDNWEVQSSAKSCMMLSTFADDVTIGLISPEGGNLSFMVGGEGIAREVPGGQKVTLDLKFAGTAPHNDWTDEAARVLPRDNGRVAVIADWGPSLAAELGDTVTASSTVTVTVGGQTIGTYDLAGSPAAYRALMKCGGQTG